MLFFINFIMNAFILWVVAKIIRSKKKFRWVILGAGVMSLLYTLLIAVPALRFVNVALASVVILAVGVVVSFHPKDAKLFLRTMVVSYCIAFAVGGLGMALFFLTDIPYAIYFIAGDWGGVFRAVSWQLVLVGTVTSYILIKIGMKILERHSLKRQMLCSVQVFMGEANASFDALVDTGHSLKEPLSQSPVIIAEFEHVKNFLPDGLRVLFYENQENDFTGLISGDDSFYKRIRMIPFTSLGRSNGMLIGFRPDRVTVDTKAPPPDVIIGIYNDKLCRDGRYQGLLSPELVSQT